MNGTLGSHSCSLGTVGATIISTTYILTSFSSSSSEHLNVSAVLLLYKNHRWHRRRTGKLIYTTRRCCRWRQRHRSGVTHTHRLEYNGSRCCMYTDKIGSEKRAHRTIFWGNCECLAMQKIEITYDTSRRCVQCGKPKRLLSSADLPFSIHRLNIYLSLFIHIFLVVAVSVAVVILFHFRQSTDSSPRKRTPVTRKNIRFNSSLRSTYSIIYEIT